MEKNKMLPWALALLMGALNSVSGGVAVDQYNAATAKNDEVEHLVRVYGVALQDMAERCAP